jgi:hypothetical protein
LKGGAGEGREGKRRKNEGVSVYLVQKGEEE